MHFIEELKHYFDYQSGTGQLTMLTLTVTEDIGRYIFFKAFCYI